MHITLMGCSEGPGKGQTSCTDLDGGLVYEKEHFEGANNALICMILRATGKRELQVY